MRLAIFHSGEKRRWAALAVAALFLNSCAVGPDFKTPEAPAAGSYSEKGLPSQTTGTEGLAGAPQRFAHGADIPAQWWVLFRSEALNKLITQALQNNPDLHAAQAALREAQENLSASEGAFFPSVDGTVGTTRSKASNNGSAASGMPAYSLYNASVSVSYPLDVFGGISREVEGVEAEKDYQRFSLEAAYLTITSNVVTAAIQEASLRAQIGATQSIIDDERKQLDLLKRQFELGAVAKAAVLAQEATLAQTLATMPPLEKQLSQTRHQLAALAGRLPSEGIEATFDLSQLHLPESLPVSLPSQLVAQRPDIQAATAQLHAASASIGVATANMLPQFTLTGSYGISATQIASLFVPGTAFWSLGASLLQPIFRGGELLHKKRASEAAFDKVAAQYRSTVLAAFQNVADSLRALESDAEALKAQVAADRAAEDSLKLAREQYNAGAISYLSLLTAEQTRDQARIALVKAQAQRFADTAALFQSLGGGWWNRDQNLETKSQNAETAPAVASPEPRMPNSEFRKNHNFRSNAP